MRSERACAGQATARDGRSSKPEPAMGEPHQAELGLNVFLLGFVVDVSNINPPAACDLATMVNLAQGKGAVLR